MTYVTASLTGLNLIHPSSIVGVFSTMYDEEGSCAKRCDKGDNIVNHQLKLLVTFLSSRLIDFLDQKIIRFIVSLGNDVVFVGFSGRLQ